MKLWNWLARVVKAGVQFIKNANAEPYDFYGPTIEDDPDYYAQDERGKAFLRKWYSDWKKLL